MRLVLSLAVLAAVGASGPGLAQIPGVPGTGGAAAGLAGGLSGEGLGAPAKRLLARASDNALDELSKPGAFAADRSIRISLPGPAGSMGSMGGSMGGAMGGMMNMAGASGMGGDLTGALNTAAGEAAGAAKPIFRSAIEKMTLQDAMGLKSQTGATDYLRRSAGEQIRAELAPLVHRALEATGVLSKVSALSAVGLNEASLTDYVTSKTADGIYAYMGRAEQKMRQNPMGLLGR